jgi:hypothetical protein
MVDRRYSLYSDGWYESWTRVCHLTDSAAGLGEGARVKPNYINTQHRARSRLGYIRALYPLGGWQYATVEWTTGGSAEIPLRALIPA